jgi:hypothetical protein
MNSLAEPKSTGREAIERLQVAMSEMPQASLETQHLFTKGIYGRVMTAKAGTTIVGKVHRKEHLFFVCSGTILVSDGESNAKEITGPAFFVSAPGTKRAGFAVTDVTCVNIHRTDKVDLDEIEEELIEPDEAALFDARNELKELT